MKRFYILALAFAPLALGAQTTSQTDSTLDRTVTVERQFQPVIQPAGRLSVAPTLYQPTLQPLTPTYSTYANPLDLDFNFERLGYYETEFGHPKPLKGFLRAGVGHIHSVFDFAYRLSDRKDVRLDLQAHHHGQWGLKTLSESRLGFDFSKLFSSADLFFGVAAQNDYYTRYGAPAYRQSVLHEPLTAPFRYADLRDEDKMSNWSIDTKVGVRSLPNQAIQYLVQTGYEAFVMGHFATEHQINTQLGFEWSGNNHHAGLHASVQNRFYSVQEPDWSVVTAFGNDTVKQNHHAIKVEPYYAYTGKRFTVHAGINIDCAVGKGKVCLPSPNLTFEGKLTKTWLALYGGAVGNYNITSERDNFRYNRYLHPLIEITDTHNRTYIPVDAFLGFRIRPCEDLLLDIFAHYIYTKYDVFYHTAENGFFTLLGDDHQRLVVGGKVDYHYQDWVSIHLDGQYSKYYMKSLAYAYYRPSWEVNLRVDVKVNSKWSLYSDNYFAGGRYANTFDFESRLLAPTIDLNLGVRYNINKWLSTYLQLNNYLNRKNIIFDQYESQGINFVLGIVYTF